MDDAADASYADDQRGLLPEYASVMSERWLKLFGPDPTGAAHWLNVPVGTFVQYVPVGTFLQYVPVLVFICAVLYLSECIYVPFKPRNPWELTAAACLSLGGGERGESVPVKLAFVYVQFRPIWR